MFRLSARFATLILATALGLNYARADFCGDLKLAFAKSSDFANLRGPAEEGHWKAMIGLAGAKSCFISKSENDRFDFVCKMNTFIDKQGAQKELQALVSEVSTCAPEPSLSYNIRWEDTRTSFIFMDSAKKIRGHASMLNVKAPPSPLDPPDILTFDPRTGKESTIKIEQRLWVLGIVVFGQ